VRRDHTTVEHVAETGAQPRERHGGRERGHEEHTPSQPRPEREHEHRDDAVDGDDGNQRVTAATTDRTRTGRTLAAVVHERFLVAVGIAETADWVPARTGIRVARMIEETP
jgi:hypothetical protein